MVSEKTVDEILEQNGNPLITLSMPTHKKGEEVKQDPIRFKNLLTKVQERLDEMGMKQAEYDKLLKKAHNLLEQPRFWTHQDHGLVVYIAKNHFSYYKLPYDVEERAYVNTHFLITPILPMVSMDGVFNVLAVSRSNARLLQCTRNEVRDITPEGANTSVDDYLEEAPEQELQFHTGAEGNDAMFFGHGAGDEDRRIVVEQYFRELEKNITDMLKQSNDPLVMVGLEDNIAFYKKINNYNRTVDNIIDANPDEMKDAELKSAGWKVIQEHFLKDMYRSLEQFSEHNNEKVSNNIADVIESTVMGRSKTIFITRGEDRWGHYDEEKHEVHLTDEPSNGDVDLLNWLAAKGRETGSNVYMLPRDQMPLKATVAAEFRF
ncbi:hypothetical protein DYD21_00175 [Rhodohalobacter sp. SW132]|uniref:baeRF7 domain-containing protein n=1 Tax=Rhodohalobacter sp. SW132 TaxID=2293433 RepID=UPI000E259782|nr:hypothetical protein [Rhodohalobacter sp. SW132]REL38407.1 hypothetical protein DYD21_00175 [Rhodohalobacter sp. SW132]